MKAKVWLIPLSLGLSIEIRQTIRLRPNQTATGALPSLFLSPTLSSTVPEIAEAKLATGRVTLKAGKLGLVWWDLSRMYRRFRLFPGEGTYTNGKIELSHTYGYRRCRKYGSKMATKVRRPKEAMSRFALSSVGSP